MIDGFYMMAFTGTAGSGFGMLVFYQGNVAGADVAGATYDGRYTETETGDTSFEVTMIAPAGITPVQTGIPLAAPLTTAITGTLKSNDIATAQPILLQTQLGPVNVIFKKIRAFP